ncbi:hypothetical protein Pyrfu_1593 [Pyrolobus fumarii 1A]|uniref:Ribbon-helix-helix protein CopG domain-containing protein n=1 Tax=Pyrolobus fumarii (strain DSM 11204 / 1A) TaxID=694429 RepID=G0EC80_PYRF1|nr:ribbon-helix-helix domain-containing protein [Pyrolobus fumarii]AEM39450.1 hypothetical protein Pyrfu_1593 [Pyrolobus fumarii 1A]
MKLVTVKMPETYVEGLDELVRMGRYSSRSEAIRVAVRELLKRELWGATLLEDNVMAFGEEDLPSTSGVKKVVVHG